MISNIQMPSTIHPIPSNTTFPSQVIPFFCFVFLLSQDCEPRGQKRWTSRRATPETSPPILAGDEFCCFLLEVNLGLKKTRNTNEKPKQHNSFCFDATFLFLEFRSWSIMIVGNLFSLTLSYHKVQRETLRIPTRKDIHQTLLHMRHAWLYW